MLYIDPLMIENHVYEQLLKEHVLDHTNFATLLVMAHIFLGACFLILQIEVF